MEIIRDIHRSDVVILDTSDIDNLVRSQEVKGAGIVIKRKKTIRDEIFEARNDRIRMNNSYNILLIPNDRWSDFCNEILTSNSTVDLFYEKIVSDGRSEYMDMKLYSYSGKDVLVK